MQPDLSRERSVASSASVSPLVKRPFHVGSSVAQLGAILGPTILMFVLLAATVALPAGSASHAIAHRSTDTAAAQVGPLLACNRVVTPTPSALLVHLKLPTQNLSLGGSIGFQMELQIVNYTNGSTPVNLTFPYVYFDFPLSTGGEFTTALTPRNVTINASGWTSPTFLSRSVVTSHALNFTPSGSARMTTQKLAVMTDGNYGSVLLDVRWRWTEQQPNQTVVLHSPWSYANPKSAWPTNVPSEFYPATYVRLVNTSASPAFIGNNFTMTIAGPYVAGEWFYQELEHPGSGHVVEGFPETAPTTSSVFPVQVPLLNYVNYLVNGTYLAHVHDECGAMLYSRSVVAVLPPTANITFLIPAGCGKVKFDNQSFTNGSIGVFVPSATGLYNVTPHGCLGHKFAGVRLTGGLHAVTSTRIRVSSSGTLRMLFA